MEPAGLLFFRRMKRASDYWSCGRWQVNYLTAAPSRPIRILPCHFHPPGGAPMKCKWPAGRLTDGRRNPLRRGGCASSLPAIFLMKSWGRQFNSISTIFEWNRPEWSGRSLCHWRRSITSNCVFRSSITRLTTRSVSSKIAADVLNPWIFSDFSNFLDYFGFIRFFRIF